MLLAAVLWFSVWVLRASTRPAGAVAYGVSRDLETRPAHLVYVYSPSCMDCAAAPRLVSQLGEEYPGVQVLWASTEQPGAAALRLRLNDEHRLGALEALEIPALFGASAHVGPRAVLAGACEEYEASSLPGAQTRYGTPEADGSEAARDRVPSVVWFVLGGLLDGLSPCALATLVLFASWTTLRRPTLGATMRAYALFGGGVFVVYSLAGLGLYALLAKSLASPGVRVAGQAVAAMGVMLLGVVLLEDAIRASLGRTGDLIVGVADHRKQAARRSLRWAARRGLRAGALAAAGLAVGGLELTCTGVVYGPMLAYLSSMSAPASYVASALVLHNVAFLVPLGVVAVVSARVGAKRSGEVLARPRTVANTRLATATALIALSAWMTWTLGGVVG